MARLQILELPEGSGDDRPPFVLVVDQYEPKEASPEQVLRHQNLAEQIGARAVLVFEETIDIPANDLSAYNGSIPPDAHYEVTVGGQPVTWTRIEEMQAQASEEVMRQTPHGPRPGKEVGREKPDA